MHHIVQKSFAICLITLVFFIPFTMKGTAKAVKKTGVTADKTAFSGGSVANTYDLQADALCDSLNLEKLGLSKKTLAYALKGYSYLQMHGKLVNKHLLSICDFSQSSKRKRLYIIDVDKKKLVMNTYVAHGRNSGAEYARSFSNTRESLKSSLGFYVTSNTYFGGHGLSLKIEGMEKGFNDRADARNIVVHGSDYIGCDPRSAPKAGRSYGCPAVPSQQSSTVINAIKNGSCLFIYHPTKQYLTHSRILNS